MTNILLVCSAGMSTSMLASKMQSVANEHNLPIEIWAVGDADAVNNVEKMDVMLLGPQVRFLESKMKAIAGGKPVAVIDMQSYGTMNGAKVLEQALKLLGM
ncbi:MAG TPA: PTS sugar transporter subunit IIB [Erysipelotrichaceae bacterium]|nr:PTS sugar transporter subunit IIB [Erysipelotrichaceae bacterium]